MVNENRFAGLADAEKNSSTDETNSEGEDTVQEVSTETEQDGAENDKIEENNSGPPFSFDETTAKSIYVRQKTLDILEDTELEIELRLRQDYDIRDVAGREVMDAIIRVAAENSDAIADQIITERDDCTDE